jgi:C-terminal processing protease CtpA/Prc
VEGGRKMEGSKKIKIGVIILLFFLSGIYIVIYTQDKLEKQGISERQELTLEERMEDFDYLLKVLETSYPLFEEEEEVRNVDLIERGKVYQEYILNTKSDYEFWVLLNAYFSEFASYHTDILFPDWENYKGINCYGMKEITKDRQIYVSSEQWQRYIVEEESKRKVETYIMFDYVEGEYVLNNEGAQGLSNEFKIGDVLLTIDSISVEDFLSKECSVIKKRFDHVRNKAYRTRVVLNTEQGKLVKIRIKTTQGDIKEEFVYYHNEVEAARLVEPIEAIVLEGVKGEEVLALDAFYIRIGNFQESSQKIRKAVAEGKNYSNMIIDIRDNRGGSPLIFTDQIMAQLNINFAVYNRNWRMRESEYNNKILNTQGFLERYFYPFKQEEGWYKKRDIIWTFPKTLKEYNGNIYLLVNGKTASAADFMTHVMKQKDNVTVIGTNTWGEGTAGSFNVVALPNSKLLVLYMPGYSLNDEGKCSSLYGTAPHVMLEQTKDDYIKQLELIKNNEDIGSLENKLIYDTILKETIERIKFKHY